MRSSPKIGKTMHENTPTHLSLVLIAVFTALTASCARKSAPEKCEDTAAGAAAPQKTAAPVQTATADAMWCRSCVVGPAGYMSCQTVRQVTKTETTEQLRDRARLAACKDAGFAEGTCPASGVISLACKGDPPPTDKTAAGKAMLNALKGSAPLVLTKDGKTMRNIMHPDAAGASDAAQKPAETQPKDAPKEKAAAPAPHIE